MYTIVGDIFFADLNDGETEHLVQQLSTQKVIFAFNTRLTEYAKKLLNKTTNYLLLKGKHDTIGEEMIVQPTPVLLDKKKVLMFPYDADLEKKLLCLDKVRLDAIIIGGRVSKEALHILARNTGAKLIFYRPKNDIEIETVSNNGFTTVLLGVRSRAGHVVDVDFSELPAFQIRRIKVPHGRVLV